MGRQPHNGVLSLLDMTSRADTWHPGHVAGVLFGDFGVVGGQFIVAVAGILVVGDEVIANPLFPELDFVVEPVEHFGELSFHFRVPLGNREPSLHLFFCFV